MKSALPSLADQINARIWLTDFSRQIGRRTTRCGTNEDVSFAGKKKE
jgi:hypothetical protein